MARWHHQLDEHEFEQALGDGEGQRSLACCSPWGHKESDTTERLNKSKILLGKEKNKVGGITVSNFSTSYKTTMIKTVCAAIKTDI